MLHRINLPNCLPALEWIVQLQTDLLTAVCSNAVDQAQVTLDWVIAQLPGLPPNWVISFCSWAIEGASILERMQNIAALPVATKHQLLQHFNNNLQYIDAFDNAKNPPATRPLDHGMPHDADKKYRAFLEIFYDPVFYRSKGYPVDTDGNINDATRFHKDIFLDRCHKINDDLRVCPLCDGSLDGSQVDHWLPKKYFPELSCQPHNLIEICQACNSRSNKGEKLTLTNGDATPFDDWFHPYLRPANGKFTIRIQLKGVPQLQGGNAQDAIRLSKLDSLINLQSRWAKEYRTQIKRIEGKIRGCKRRGETFTTHSLKSLIEDWRDAVQDQIGLETHAMLEQSVLSLASDENSHLFAEFFDFAVS